MRASIFALMLFALAVHSAGCGDGGDDGDPQPAVAAVTDAQLEVMPIGGEELAAILGSPVSDGQPEAIDNEQAADRTPEEDDTTADQELAGRINGYERYHTLEQGAVDVRILVELYRDTASASAAFEKSLRDLESLEGRKVGSEPTYEIRSVETFDVERLGGEATGVRLLAVEEGSLEESTTHTAVAYTFDRLLVTASMQRSGDVEVGSQVEAIAQAQQERIRGVLSGAIADTPQPTPIPKPAGAPLTPGAEAGPASPGLPRIRVVSVEPALLAFVLIGPYRGVLVPGVDVLFQGSGCQVFEVAYSGAKAYDEVRLVLGEEISFSVAYSCGDGGVADTVSLYGVRFLRP